MGSQLVNADKQDLMAMLQGRRGAAKRDGEEGSNGAEGGMKPGKEAPGLLSGRVKEKLRTLH